MVPPTPLSRNTCLIVRPDRSADQANQPPDGQANWVKEHPDQEEQALLDRLKQRSMQLQIVNDPPSAMIALARGPAALLIVIEPQEHTRLGELLEAVERHYPHTACWGYHLDPEQLQTGQPRLERLNHQGKQDHAPSKDAGHRTEPTDSGSNEQPLVSEEELSMLLDQ